METINEINNELQFKENYAVSLELEIGFTQDQIYCEDDETHITGKNISSFFKEARSIFAYSWNRPPAAQT